MELIAEIRRRHLVGIDRISSIARDLNLSRPTVRKHLLTESEPTYVRQHQASPKLGDFNLFEFNSPPLGALAGEASSLEGAVHTP